MNWPRDDDVDAAERQHLSTRVEADWVDRLYSAAFALADKARGNRSEEELLALLGRSCYGSIRVALLARRRCRKTWDMNPSDRVAAEAYRLLTLTAASFIAETADPNTYA